MQVVRALGSCVLLVGLGAAMGACSVVNSPDDPIDPSDGSGGSGATGGSGGGASVGGGGSGQCGPGETDCNGTCVDTSSDPDHCGGCGDACPALPNATASCSGSMCSYTCTAGFDDCNTDLGTATSDGCEADLMSDPANCNMCGMACAPGAQCVGGMCECMTPPTGMAQFNATGTGNAGALQTFTVPDCVTSIVIEAFGAQGGAGTDTRGARMRGTFTVTPGEVLTILVGHRADTANSSTSGGGGTFVVDSNNQPLIVAGGGGSCFSVCPSTSETVGRTTTSGGTAGTTPRAVNGMGGNVSNTTSGAGGGFLGNGANVTGGRSFMNGGNGGLGEGFGGFGGGGARGGSFGQGGGGGYSGGSCGDTASAWAGCGGGGSFNAGTSQSNSAGVNLGDGMVVITW